MKILALLLCLLATSIAQAAPVPNEVKAALKSGALSLRFETRNIGPNGSPIGLHLYVVPVGRNTDSPRYVETKPITGPITREEIQTFDALKPSPFTLEVFKQANGTWRRINSITFTQTKDLEEINTRWLYPKRKTGPVLLLHFGYTHWHEWEVITFANGLERPAQHQTFLWGGEGEYDYVVQKFDRTDAKGKMVIAEEESHGLEKHKAGKEYELNKNVYHFDGFEWVNPKARYFVVAASLKNQADAKKAQAKYGFGEVLPSSHYSGLTPGYYVVVLGRYSNLKQAQEQVVGLKRDSKIQAYVKRAF